MSLRIELRLALYTSNGYPAGPRLERGSSLPVKRFNFALHEKDEADAALESLQTYIDKNHKEGKRK